MHLLYCVLVTLAAIAICAQQDSVFDDQGIISELGPRLSSGASIVLREASEFGNVTRRWDSRSAPKINAAVIVATEQDVQETVKYSDAKGIPIVALAGGHGSTESLRQIHEGIEIWLRKLNQISVNAGGETATIGGGAKAKEVTAALWAKKKQTVIGGCECVGMVAPILGGGHGTLQGYHGLLADQLISARLVLADGTAITVSEAENSDLFWALRGAGHNFGIVTEFTYRIYDADPDSTWSYDQFIFTGDKLEDVYKITNSIVEKQPPQVLNYGILFRIPDIDPVNPVLVYIVLYDGSSAELRKFTEPLYEIQAVSVTSGETSYPGIPAVVTFSDKDPACQPTGSALRFPIYTKTFNTSALRALYDEFSKGMERQPAFGGSFFLLESYAQQGVHAVPPESTAFAHRSERLLLSPAIFYALDASLDDEAIKWGQRMRQIILDGTGESQFHTYVNYAHGDESQQALYGAEPWRLEKLYRLKQLYDPRGKFSYYGPLTPGESATQTDKKYLHDEI